MLFPLFLHTLLSVMITSNTDTNPQVTPSPPSVVRSPIKTPQPKTSFLAKNDPPARPKNKLYERRLDVDKHMNFAVWYHMKQVFSFLVFSVLWTLLNFAIGVGIRIITRLPTKISVSIRVIKVVNWLYCFSFMLCIGFIRGGLKSKTSHIQNRYAR